MNPTNVETAMTSPAVGEKHPVRLQPVGDGIWTAHHPEFRAGGLQLGTRTTVARLRDGSLWVHSPGPLAEPLLEQLRAQGPVSYLVAPNNLHHLFVHRYAQAFPDARIAGGSRVLEKIQAPSAVEVTSVMPDWEGVIEHLPVEGIPMIDETAFFHRPSGTLILTDLCFNVQASSSWFTRAVMRLNGGWQRFGATRLMRSAMKDRGAVRRSVERILEWPVERISVCHGERVEQDGLRVFRESFEFLAAN